jgi:glutathione S-transferase
VLAAIRKSPPFFVRPITGLVASQVEAAFLNRNIDGNLAFLEDQLKTAPGGGPWICGKDLTAADILLSFPAIAASGRVLQDPKMREKYPLLDSYAKRLQEVECYKTAVKKIEEAEGVFSASM